MIAVREITIDDHKFLWRMLYLAIYSPDRELPESVVCEPSLARYATAFGRPGDYGFILSVDGQVAGAAWTRLWTEDNRGYGFVDGLTPEIAMAIEPVFRGQGHGQELLRRLAGKLRERGYAQVSLSVDKQNRAFNLYRRAGFRIVREENTTYLMAKNLG